MKILLDTHTLVWAVSQPEYLSPLARRTIDKHEVMASVVSLWELILKKSKKDRLMDDPVPWWRLLVETQGIKVLSIRADHIAAIDKLPDVHKDPFDRILVGQAVAENATILSKDRMLADYGVPVLW